MVEFIPLFVLVGVILGFVWIFVLKPTSEFTEMDYTQADSPDIDTMDTHIFEDGEKMYKYTPASANEFADPMNNTFVVVGNQW